MVNTACGKCLGNFTRPQHILLCPIRPGKHQLSWQPFSQQPLQRRRDAQQHRAVKCAAAAPKDALKETAAHDVSSWAQSMGIESSGLRVAEFAGDSIPAQITGHQEKLIVLPVFRFHSLLLSFKVPTKCGTKRA